MRTLPETGALLVGHEVGQGLDFRSHGYCEPTRPNVALAGVLLSCPVVIIAMIGFLVAGHSLFQSLLFALSLQMLTFILVLGIGYFRVDNPPGAQPVARGNEPTTPDLPDRWRSYRNSVVTAASQRVAVMSCDMAQGHSLATDFADLGREVHHCTDREAIFDSVSARPGDWSLVICDLDTAPDRQAMMDDLADFREVCPEMPVLLFSGGALREDLSPDCLPVWDADLRRTVFRKSSFEGMAATGFNLTAAE